MDTILYLLTVAVSHMSFGRAPNPHRPVLLNHLNFDKTLYYI